MGGQIAEALAGLDALYDRGADPLAVMQDLLEITHFLTRVKVAPGAEGFFDGSSGEAKRAAEMAAKLSVPSLTRAWSMLLKGLFEVRDAARPVAACEMALIRLAYAADLPPTDKLVRDLLDNPPNARNPRSRVRGEGKGRRGQVLDHLSPLIPQRGEGEHIVGDCASQPKLPTPQPSAPSKTSPPSPSQGAPVLKVHLENDVHLVSLEPGRLEFRPGPRAPRTLAGDLAQKLKDWTGTAGW